MSPARLKVSQICSSVVWKERFPTYTVVDVLSANSYSSTVRPLGWPLLSVKKRRSLYADRVGSSERSSADMDVDVDGGKIHKIRPYGSL